MASLAISARWFRVRQYAKLDRLVVGGPVSVVIRGQVMHGTVLRKQKHGGFAQVSASQVWFDAKDIL